VSVTVNNLPIRVVKERLKLLRIKRFVEYLCLLEHVCPRVIFDSFGHFQNNGLILIFCNNLPDFLVFLGLLLRELEASSAAV
jgi:hypothetical protein